MKSRIALCLLAAAGALTSLAHADAVAHDDAKKASTTGAHSAAMPAMSEEDMAMMKAWEKASTPGKEHEGMKAMEGTFEAKVTSRMKPDAPTETSTGRAENRLIFGGRHLESRFTGTFMNMPFEGVGYTSYDNLKKEYVSTWLDSMATGVMTSTGTADASGKTIKMSGECVDPMTGKTTTNKQVLTIDGPNRHVLEMWAKDPKTGDDYKAMEIVYTRAGNAQQGQD